VKAGVMSTHKSISIVRNYQAAPDECVRALSLLLQASLNSQVSKGGPHDLTGGSTKECTRPDQKGKENADLHGD
jgi:hypothetical protein